MPSSFITIDPEILSKSFDANLLLVEVTTKDGPIQRYHYESYEGSYSGGNGERIPRTYERLVNDEVLYPGDEAWEKKVAHNPDHKKGYVKIVGGPYKSIANAKKAFEKRMKDYSTHPSHYHSPTCPNDILDGVELRVVRLSYGKAIVSDALK